MIGALFCSWCRNSNSVNNEGIDRSRSTTRSETYLLFRCSASSSTDSVTTIPYWSCNRIDRLFAISLSPEWSRIVFFFPVFTIFFLRFIDRINSYFFAADRGLKPASSQHGSTLLLNYYATGTMDVFGGINLFLVQGGIFGEQNRLFFTKNVKEKEVFPNNGIEKERCIHENWLETVAVIRKWKMKWACSNLSFRAKRGIYRRVQSWISSQVGFVDSMSASFFRLRQLLICFSRAIAQRMSEISSK